MSDPEEYTHVYDWLDQPPKDEGEKLAKAWLGEFVKPADEKNTAWLNARSLTCEYEGVRYRCVGASRLGDVWLTPKIENPDGYELRVAVDDLGAWLMVPAKRRSNQAQKVLAATALLGSAYLGGLGARRKSSHAVRNDPDREKTPLDLKRMAAAEAKRRRKAAKSNFKGSST